MKICPLPIKWNEIYQHLLEYAENHKCNPEKPPVPFILGAWWSTNDKEKLTRWTETIQWAKNNNCQQLINSEAIEYYEEEIPTEYEIGPLGGPMYLPWSNKTKKPLDEKIELALLKKLSTNWLNIVGEKIGQVTKPIRFAGRKSRKLIVYADPISIPPWDSWHKLPDPQLDQEKRRTFTKFRESINKAIVPHIIDHVDFVHVSNEIEE